MPEPTAGAVMARPKRVQTVENKPQIDTSAIEPRKPGTPMRVVMRKEAPDTSKMSDLDILEQIGTLLGPLSRKRRKQILAILERMS